jgi:lysozyme
MKTSEKGLALIKQFEGLRLQAYQCAANVWTIGYGRTAGVRPGDAITPEQADVFLREDVSDAERAVSRFVRVPLTQHQFDALFSFTFNLGTGNLRTSTLLRLLNAGDSRELQNCCYAGSTLAGNGSPGWYDEGRLRNLYSWIRRFKAEVPVKGNELNCGCSARGLCEVLLPPFADRRRGVANKSITNNCLFSEASFYCRFVVTEQH